MKDTALLFLVCCELLGELWEDQIFQFRASLHHQLIEKEPEHSGRLGHTTFDSWLLLRKHIHLMFQVGKNKHECLQNDSFSALSQAGSTGPFSIAHVLIPLGNGKIQLYLAPSWLSTVESHSQIYQQINILALTGIAQNIFSSHSAVAEKFYWYFYKSMFYKSILKCPV